MTEKQTSCWCFGFKRLNYRKLKLRKPTPMLNRPKLLVKWFLGVLKAAGGGKHK